MIQPLIKKVNSNPKLIFLFDGCGAILSAFLLGAVLVKYQNLIGMPRQILFILSSIASLFAIYSLSYALRINDHWRTFLKVIAIANLSYCALTLGLLFYHQSTITNLGIAYFLLEKAVVIPLALFELKIANEKQK